MCQRLNVGLTVSCVSSLVLKAMASPLSSSIQRGSAARCSLTQKWTTLIRSTALDDSAEGSHCGNEGQV